MLRAKKRIIITTIAKITVLLFILIILIRIHPNLFFLKLYHIKIYKKCGERGTTLGGDHGKETVDIAVPFFVNALK